MLVARTLTTRMIFAIYAPSWLSQLAGYPGAMARLTQLFSRLLIAVALHFSRFFFVHGRAPAGRELKIEAKIEQQLLRELRREKRQRESALRDVSGDSAMTDGSADNRGEISIEDLLQGQSERLSAN